MQTWYMSAGTPARTASTSEANTIPRSASESAIAEMPTFFKTIDAPKKKWELTKATRSHEWCTCRDSESADGAAPRARGLCARLGHHS